VWVSSSCTKPRGRPAEAAKRRITQRRTGRTAKRLLGGGAERPQLAETTTRVVKAKRASVLRA